MMQYTRTTLAALLAAGLLLVGCNNDANNVEDEVDEPVQITILEEGIGTDTVRSTGDLITAHYVLTLDDGRIVENSWTSGNAFFAYIKATDDTSSYEQPSEYGIPIEGWLEGVPGMKVNELRRLVVPPSKGYEGTDNQLANETLYFTIQLLTIKKREDVPEEDD